MTSTYEIRSIRRADLTLLHSWRTRPHVRRWWGEPGVEPDIEKFDDPGIALWIASHAGYPFAFLQDYEIHAWPDHHFHYLPPGSRGIDMYIGEAHMLGVGHGAILLRQHVDQLFRRGTPAVGIDPHPDNIAAIRCFEKAGFTITREGVETDWGPAVLMDRRNTP
ncbi:GNAT family N-acetyltransferase [Alcanivorax sp. 24]|uniref:GNAT family N-acetyltransferase n=1 Tax=Alcanivorax sp. 24 TaxID=2545266 RepID=UPI001060A4FD|nr:GNAT family N-acetyltransferase [Alcanivorax sp. 24]